MRMDMVHPGAMQLGYQFYGEPGHVVSLVGGGGKTTLLYNMARMSAEEGSRVLVTTTTHIGKPRQNFAKNAQEARKLWARGTYAVIGTQEGQRLSMPDRKLLDELMKEADLTVIEADGAKGLPCKAPRDKEPVILPQCDMVTAVLGVSAIGRPIREVCFCLEEVRALLGVEETHILSEQDAAKILASEAGSRKGVGQREYFVVLNQCDDDKRRKCGKRIAKLLFDRGIYNVVLTSFDPAERSDRM